MLVHTQPPAKQYTQATRKQDFKERHSVHVLHYSIKWIPNKIQQLPFDRHDIYSVYSATAAVRGKPTDCCSHCGKKKKGWFERCCYCCCCYFLTRKSKRWSRLRHQREQTLRCALSDEPTLPTTTHCCSTGHSTRYTRGCCCTTTTATASTQKSSRTLTHSPTTGPREPTPIRYRTSKVLVTHVTCSPASFYSNSASISPLPLP
jgi:hypothetical protein